MVSELLIKQGEKRERNQYSLESYSISANFQVPVTCLVLPDLLLVDPHFTQPNPVLFFYFLFLNILILICADDVKLP